MRRNCTKHAEVAAKREQTRQDAVIASQTVRAKWEAFKEYVLPWLRNGK